MTDDANRPDPVPTDDDTAWAEPDGQRPMTDKPEKDIDQVIREGTAVLGTPD